MSKGLILGGPRSYDLSVLRSDIAEMFRLGREEGIDVNEKDVRDQTALIVALRHPIYEEEQYRTIQLLLQLGADPNVTGESQLRGLEGIPIHLAVAMNTFSLNKPHGDSKRLATLVIEEILKHGGKIAAQILVTHGATIMPRDNAGKTPLDYTESATMINFLKSHGATELNH